MLFRLVSEGAEQAVEAQDKVRDINTWELFSAMELPSEKDYRRGGQGANPTVIQ